MTRVWRYEFLPKKIEKPVFSGDLLSFTDQIVKMTSLYVVKAPFDRRSKLAWDHRVIRAMVIVGGSETIKDVVLGGFLIWFVQIEAEPAGLWLAEFVTAGLAEGKGLRQRLPANAPHM